MSKLAKRADKANAKVWAAIDAINKLGAEYNIPLFQEFENEMDLGPVISLLADLADGEVE